MTLTEKQRRFAHEYSVDYNATQAAIRAGYSEKTAGAQGHELLKKLEIQSLVAELHKQQNEKADTKAAEILAELDRLALANPHDYMVPGPDGDPVMKKFADLTREELAAVQTFEVKRLSVGGKDNDAEVITYRVAQHPKVKAIELALKRRGLMVERVENIDPATMEEADRAALKRYRDA